MFKAAKKAYYHAGAAITTGLIFAASDASAQTTTTAGNSFSTIAENVNDSISQIPGLITGLAYLLGLTFGVLGIIKIKDHVENPGNEPLKNGVIRLVVGGFLFALPILFEAMLTTIEGNDSGAITQRGLNAVEFKVD